MWNDAITSPTSNATCNVDAQQPQAQPPHAQPLHQRVPVVCLHSSEGDCFFHALFAAVDGADVRSGTRSLTGGWPPGRVEQMRRDCGAPSVTLTGL